MALEKVYIPYGGYWSSPFCRWQGSLSNHNSVVLASEAAKAFMAGREISPEGLDNLGLGFTVPQKHSFYGAPWFAALIGAPGITGNNYAQACATSARVMAALAAEIEAGYSECALGVTCDRTSNGPHVYYPNPNAPGGKGDTEEWVWDNFNHDPHAGNAMIQTAENVAKEHGISREEQDQLTLLRNEQYAESLKDDRAFQKRYMLPVDVGNRRKPKIVEADEGVFPTTPDGLAKLKPVQPDGSVTFGTQTYPGDGNAGVLLCSRERAEALSKDKSVPVQLLSFAQTRVKKGFMPMAPAPAAKLALKRAGVDIADLKATKTHNPFAVNDVFFSREMGIAPEKFNNYGSPLVYGHPQGPTGMRVTIELIEELAAAGGGFGLFSGCAAGDTAMALVLRVG